MKNKFNSICIIMLILLAGNALFAQTTSLKEVSITATKPVIYQKADRIVYDLQADPESKGNSVLSMMHKIPFISLDGSENILLKGNSSYKVLINGKPSGMVNSNLTTILRSMPASTIQKIEVITTPPSEYDAEGLAGIINIITNKKISDRYNGTLAINETAPVGGPGAGGSFTAKQGKFGISAFGGGNLYNSLQTDFTNDRTSTDNTILHQNGSGKSKNVTGYLGAQLSYEIDSLNLISGQFNISGNKTNGNSNLYSTLSGATSQEYNLLNHNTGDSYGIDAAVNYQLGFKTNKNRFLTFSYMYSTNPQNQYADINILKPVNFTTPSYNQGSHQSFKEQSFQLDFVTPVKRLNIQAGLKAIIRKNSSDFYYNSSSTIQSDLYTNTQNVFSAYNSYQFSLKSWNISAGIRAEQTVIKADFISSASAADQNYLNIVPSVAVEKAFKNQSNITLGFSQRIRRPGINRLNPYIDRSNPNIESTGNPDLRPVLLNDIQAGYSSNKKLALNIGLDYSFMNNLDLKVASFDPSSNITRITYANVGKAKSLGSNFNIGYPVTKWYNVSLNGNLMYLWLEGTNDGIVVNNNRWIYFLSLSNGFRLNGGWQINTALNIASRNPNGLLGTSNGMVNTAFGVNKELIQNKLSLSAGVKNPFTKFRNNENQTFGSDFKQFSTNRDYFRSFNISLNYNFGGLKQGINKSKSEIRNDDLSN